MIIKFDYTNQKEKMLINKLEHDLKQLNMVFGYSCISNNEIYDHKTFKKV